MYWALLAFGIWIGLVSLNNQSRAAAYRKAVDDRRKQGSRLDQAFQEDKKSLDGGIERVHDTLDKLASESTLPQVCSAGCSHCCRQAIDAFRPEISKVQAYVASMPPDLKRSISTEAAQWVREYNSFYGSFNFGDGIFCGDDPDAVNPSEFAGRIAHTRYEMVINAFNSEKPRKCPFLHKGLCSIYPVRPGMCRAHFQTDNVNECVENHMRTGDPESRLLLNKLFDGFGGIKMGVPLLHAVRKELELKETMLGMDGLQRYAQALSENPNVDWYIFPKTE